MRGRMAPGRRVGGGCAGAWRRGGSLPAALLLPLRGPLPAPTCRPCCCRHRRRHAGCTCRVCPRCCRFPRLQARRCGNCGLRPSAHSAVPCGPPHQSRRVSGCLRALCAPPPQPDAPPPRPPARSHPRTQRTAQIFGPRYKDYNTIIIRWVASGQAMRQHRRRCRCTPPPAPACWARSPPGRPTLAAPTAPPACPGVRRHAVAVPDMRGDQGHYVPCFMTFHRAVRARLQR